jgi:hypothetical protein
MMRCGAGSRPWNLDDKLHGAAIRPAEIVHLLFNAIRPAAAQGRNGLIFVAPGDSAAAR